MAQTGKDVEVTSSEDAGTWRFLLEKEGTFWISSVFKVDVGISVSSLDVVWQVTKAPAVEKTNSKTSVL